MPGQTRRPELSWPPSLCSTGCLEAGSRAGAERGACMLSRPQLKCRGRGIPGMLNRPLGSPDRGLQTQVPPRPIPRPHITPPARRSAHGSCAAAPTEAAASFLRKLHTSCPASHSTASPVYPTPLLLMNLHVRILTCGSRGQGASAWGKSRAAWAEATAGGNAQSPSS